MSNDLLQEISETTAATATVALAEYSSLWQAVQELPGAENGETRRAELAEQSKERALLLTALARAIAEYKNDLGTLPKERDPRILQELLSALAESYTLVALSSSLQTLQPELMLSPQAMRQLLDQPMVDFLRTYGEEEARKILQSLQTEQ